MKQLLCLIAFCCAFTACNKEKPNIEHIDPYAMLAINASVATAKAIPSAPYSMDTVVRYAFETMFYSDIHPNSVRGGIPKHDLARKKFWFGENQEVIKLDDDGNPQLGWITTSNLRDFVIVAARRRDNLNEWVDAYRHWDLRDYVNNIPSFIYYDTIGYVPNRVIKENEATIKKAFDEQNYDRCLQLFETAYVFTPITGPEWRALKAKNEH